MICQGVLLWEKNPHLTPLIDKNTNPIAKSDGYVSADKSNINGGNHDKVGIKRTNFLVYVIS